MISGGEKITRAHQERLAYVYVRQSDPKQVRQNLESQRYQYELPGLIESLGWPPESIVILDEDLGHTASGLRNREDFVKLRSEVCEGQVGLVMGVETSRLARNNREWYHLLDVCAVFGTLVAEPGRVYDPREYDDRLHLGLKGILSEAEVYAIKMRMVAAAQRKAERGELAITPPVGLVLDADGNAVLDPDLGVQQLMRSLLEKFDELGSVRKVLKWMLENGVKMPRRVGGTGLFSKVTWKVPTYPAVLGVFTNPRYAGAYVRGRSEKCLRVEGGEPRSYSRRLPMEKWRVVIPGRHVGYISWDEFLRNRERMRQNCGRYAGRVAPGRGPGLLQGLIRCGRCGARMQAHYRAGGRGRKGGSQPFYRCGRDSAEVLTKPCQSVNAPLVDGVVREAFLSVLEPARLEISVEALERLEESTRAADRHWQLKIERGRYEAERAQRQYDQVEPENRLVARDLERRWEERLEELQRLEAEYGRWKKQKESPFDAGRIDELRELVKDVRTLWNAPSTTNEDRKELLRLLIEDVWISCQREARQVEVRILWKGGSQTVHRAAWWLNGRGIEEEVLRRIRALQTEGLLDEEIAQRLTTEGCRRSDGGNFNRHNVRQIRKRYGIPKVPRPREPDVYTATEAGKKLRVTRETLKSLIRDGALEATRHPKKNEWKIKLTEEDEARFRRHWKQENESTVPEVSKRLGIPDWQVYYWLDQMNIQARRTRVGRRNRVFLPEKEVRKMEQRLGSNNQTRG